VREGEETRGADVVQADRLEEGGECGKWSASKDVGRRVQCEEGIEDGACLSASGLVPEDGLHEECVEVVRVRFLD